MSKFDAKKFLNAQDGAYGAYKQALAEIKNGKKVSTPRKYTMLMWHICLSNARGQQYDFNLILFRP